MIGYDEAIRIIEAQGKQHGLTPETISLDEIANRICAEDILAPIANQPFDNSAMDGFALKAEDLSGAANDNPVTLEVIGRIIAGAAEVFRAPSHGQCYEIMTGAPMPPGCDTVVPVEKTEVRKDKVLFRAAPSRDENVRRAGEDFPAGALVARKGMKFNIQHILPLATLGIGQIRVLRKPKVAMLSTGLEVVDDLKTKLDPGKIYNSTGPYLRQMLPALGAETLFYGTVADEPGEFRKKLVQMVSRNVDIIVTTGAVSAGAYDFIRTVLEESGAEVLFHKVRIRPGKPVLFARLPDGGPLFVGLPGNPVASAAGLRFFVYPLMRAMQGLSTEEPQKGLLCNNHNKGKAEFRLFLRAAVRHTGKTTHEVEILQKQQSFMVSSFIEANAWAIAPEGVSEMKAGDLVDFFPFLPC